MNIIYWLGCIIIGLEGRISIPPYNDGKFQWANLVILFLIWLYWTILWLYFYNKNTKSCFIKYISKVFKNVKYGKMLKIR